MATAIVTGSGGLIGSESVQSYARAGYDVVGIGNDMRAQFFGPEASTAPTTDRLVDAFPQSFHSVALDIRDVDGLERVFAEHASDLAVVIHAAAQLSHDWAARDPANHAGARLHGFLSYLTKCTMTGEAYRIYGYGGKQVRDNLHSADVVAPFDAYRRAPRPAVVYNMGGGRASNCPMLEAIDQCQAIAGRELAFTFSETDRIGDHRWWISDLDASHADYPEWDITYDVDAVMREIHEQNAESWTPVG